MVASGVLEEARALVARGVDPRLPSMSAHGYVHWAAHLRGEIDLETAVARTVRDVRAYSRRQMTWFRRDPAIRWYDPTLTDPLEEIIEAAA
jgi:tRNA dimethylallyltransferase